MTARHKWGRAGERLDVAEADRRRREVVARAKQDRAAQLASDQAAYPRWRAGLVVPFRITMARRRRLAGAFRVNAAAGRSSQCRG